MFSFLSTCAAIFVMAVSVQAQNTTMMMVDVNGTMTNGPTDGPMMMTTTMDTMMGGNDSTTVTPQAPSNNDDTTTMVLPDDDDFGFTTTPIIDTTPDVPCNNSVGRLDEIYQFTTTADFTDLLSQNEQILVYEVLAAAEGCKMTSFMNAETAERIFRMLGSLPVRHVYIFLHYMAEALEYEGVVAPQ